MSSSRPTSHPMIRDDKIMSFVTPEPAQQEPAPQQAYRPRNFSIKQGEVPGYSGHIATLTQIE